MSEFSAVAGNGRAGNDGPDHPEGPIDEAARQDANGAHDAPDPGGEPDAEAPDRGPVPAVLRGGPAAGKQVLVPRIAGAFPLFIGVDGGNYVRDKGSNERPVYNWWPAGASSPAGDPAARSDSR